MPRMGWLLIIVHFEMRDLSKSTKLGAMRGLHMSDHTPLAAHHRTTRCYCIWSYHDIASGFQSLWVNEVLREEYNINLDKVET